MKVVQLWIYSEALNCELLKGEFCELYLSKAIIFKKEKSKIVISGIHSSSSISSYSKTIFNPIINMFFP